jgi:hypothetical protein
VKLENQKIENRDFWAFAEKKKKLKIPGITGALNAIGKPKGDPPLGRFSGVPRISSGSACALTEMSNWRASGEKG